MLLFFELVSCFLLSLVYPYYAVNGLDINDPWMIYIVILEGFCALMILIKFFLQNHPGIEF